VGVKELRMRNIALKTTEKNRDKIAVVGGGPSGSFFAIHLLREARRINRQVEVLIIEKNWTLEGQSKYRKCNFGAGGISPRLNEMMEQHGIHIPPEIIQDEIHRIWIHGLWKNIPVKVPNEMRMSSVFRGTLPPRLAQKKIGFDTFLLRKAIEEGAQVLAGNVKEIVNTESGLPSLVVQETSGEVLSIQASFVAVSTGVNAERGEDYGNSEIIRSIIKLNPSFIPAKLRKTIVFELEVGRDSLEKNLRGEVYFIEYGSKDLPLEHIALVPKGEYLTVAAIGRFVDKASLPKEAAEVIKSILKLPQLHRIFPDIVASPVACACWPMMTVSVAKNPYADRLALIGDAVGARLYKDGLYSAYLTGSHLAQTVLHEGTDKRTLQKFYGKTVKWLSVDNRFGKLVFRMIGLTFGNPFLSRILYQTFATELKMRTKSRRPLGEVLWKIASGTAGYKQVFKDMFSIQVLRSAFCGGFLVTLRNVFTEFLFGLKWGEYGRYPTVILKEKRGYIKDSISATLAERLDDTQDFERMYAIKIKASREKIFEELGKFGDDRRNYIWLRFVDITRIFGSPNQSESVVRYRLKLVPLAVDLRLNQVKTNEVLFYEVSEKYADKGKLIFEIKPTKDGNNRLSIYTAFDFKKGTGPVSGIFWRLFRILFPSYVHDVVWNHALCSIKEDAEREERARMYKRQRGGDFRSSLPV
jgi:flavin-dependent dehydrogenase